MWLWYKPITARVTVLLWIDKCFKIIFSISLIEKLYHQLYLFLFQVRKTMYVNIVNYYDVVCNATNIQYGINTNYNTKLL